VDRLIGLIRNMLDTSVLEEGRMKLVLQSLDVNKLIEEQMDSLESITRNHRLRWQPGAIPLVQADRDRVMQVVTNFVTNAVKYSPEGTPIIISTTDQQDKVLVSVQDQGVGIPPEAQKLVFERYYRVEGAPREKGFGLGLYICAEIIKAHYGTIGVSSNPGQGSTFYFTLPYS
jgi:signal transduction histidine kinase